MAKKTDSKIDKRSIARTLYLDGNYTQEEIAVKVGVSRQTIIRWSKEDSWAELKASLSVTPTQLIAQWQQQIAEINRTITSREEGARYATPAEADAMLKLATSIKKIQDDLGISEVISVCMRFLAWLRPLDVEQAKAFNSLMDVFIKDQASSKR
jgi:putative ATPase subunit of terminase (gpP-like)|uniref:Terminase ATPase subunit n=1 Tax=Siphoviridae sp. ctJ0s2 TaxID=2827834 RepID=A0A8S5TEF3_9CAUD|nr:MAG TPA: terminase ATPase subunit [Siphoviridae sp. ctJ0s2]